ncbi:hypothetical protein V6N12_064895 [Hibiscus sabdariffa]|uniref:Uncharacterized protein n=1 Tax=Hibiscus sabdariffa TaxID=183260 RepID=A0ABR2G854_9ROSI
MELDLSPKLAKKVPSKERLCPFSSNGIFTGFTTDFVKRARDVDDDTAKALIGNQQGKGIVKLDANVKMPEPKPDHRKGMALNCEEAPLDTDIKNAGNVVLLNTKNLPLVGQVGRKCDVFPRVFL